MSECVFFLWIRNMLPDFAVQYTLYEFGRDKIWWFQRIFDQCESVTCPDAHINSKSTYTHTNCTILDLFDKIVFKITTNVFMTKSIGWCVYLSHFNCYVLQLKLYRVSKVALLQSCCMYPITCGLSKGCSTITHTTDNFVFNSHKSNSLAYWFLTNPVNFTTAKIHSHILFAFCANTSHKRPLTWDSECKIVVFFYFQKKKTTTTRILNNFIDTPLT